MKEYYHQLAPGYDRAYVEPGSEPRERRKWIAERRGLESVLEALRPGRTVDAACGTAFLTARVSGVVLGLDASMAMLAIARRRLGRCRVLCGDAMELPFGNLSFDRLLTAHFYGHLVPGKRERFVTEARRVAHELIVVDSPRPAGESPYDVWERRQLPDGSRYDVYKRYFDARLLAEELGGGTVLFEGDCFVAVAA